MIIKCSYLINIYILYIYYNLKFLDVILLEFKNPFPRKYISNIIYNQILYY